LNPPGRISKFSDPSLSMDHNGLAAHLTSPCVIVIGCALGGTDMLWSGSAEDGHVRSECERDGGTDTDWYR
jgi:hypothetical protein